MLQVETSVDTNQKEVEGDTSAVIPIGKAPKRILHFSDGILEEYSDDEQQVDGTEEVTDIVDPNSLKWVPFMWYYLVTFGSKTLHVCDYMGEYLAYFFGITSPKYQYEIDEYLWQKKQEEANKEEGNVVENWTSEQTDDNPPISTQPNNLQRY